MLISLIAPLKDISSQTLAALREMESFLMKWPLEFELILIFEPSQNSSENRDNLKKFVSQKVHLKLIENTQVLGRGYSLEKGLRQAAGDWMMPFDLNFSVPLGELFAFIQEMQSPEPPDFIIGNRKTAKKKQERAPISPWHLTLENILLEKWRKKDQSIVDPLCAYWALRRPAFEKIKPALKLHRWHYSLDILPHLLDEKMTIRQIPLLVRDRLPSQIPLFREYLKNIF